MKVKILLIMCVLAIAVTQITLGIHIKVQDKQINDLCEMIDSLNSQIGTKASSTDLDDVLEYQKENDVVFNELKMDLAEWNRLWNDLYKDANLRYLRDYP